MPNEYSIQIHNFISNLINLSENELQKDNDPEFHKGRLEELAWIRQYLADNIDLKDFNYY